VKRPDRRGTLLPALLVFVVAATYASLEAGTFWEAALRRDREDQLSWALAHLQSAVDEATQRLGRPPRDLDEVLALRPAVMARVPLDPLSARPDWVLRDGRVHAGADAEAFDGTRCASWHAVRAGRTWRIAKGEAR
jgi:hypothetical protein